MKERRKRRVGRQKGKQEVCKVKPTRGNVSFVIHFRKLWRVGGRKEGRKKMKELK
jgi:hypothetical protein